MSETFKLQHTPLLVYDCRSLENDPSHSQICLEHSSVGKKKKKSQLQDSIREGISFWSSRLCSFFVHWFSSFFFILWMQIELWGQNRHERGDNVLVSCKYNAGKIECILLGLCVYTLRIHVSQFNTYVFNSYLSLLTQKEKNMLGGKCYIGKWIHCAWGQMTKISTWSKLVLVLEK